MLQKDNKTEYLIFTDLDGTLLDHKTYDFSEAKEMLDFIDKQKIPLIIVTSKTKDEVIELQKKLNISMPFIIENGAGIFIPKDNTFELIALGKTYETTITTFKKYSKNFPLKGFHQMSDAEVSLHTELPIEKAKQARKRTFSEPFILEDESKLEALKKIAIEDGFDVVKGGRFYHLITFGQDKAKAVKYMKSYYENLYNKSFNAIALGDGENDITMLESVDTPILIKKHDGTFINCAIKNLIKSDYIGPKGWNESLKRILNAY
ncbi:MAG: HAD-IIB family hydrolase [Arcobacter sp.]|uniref:HAD-IIB family hydrolase n=1 Tax=Arcobacter sp. TaxID=1872629 RepID=UPI003B00B781